MTWTTANGNSPPDVPAGRGPLLRHTFRAAVRLPGSVQRVGVEVWRTAGWRDGAVSWLDERLAAAGAARTGDVEQPHLRPWATALRAPTTRGVVWLKAAGAGTAYEVRLYELLTRVAPDQVLAPLAIDAERGWIVLPDGGPTLGDALTGDALIEALTKIIPQYAQLQRALTPFADDIVALGAPDLRPGVLPAAFDEALEIAGRHLARHDTPADRDRYARVAALRPTVADRAGWLAGSVAGASLDHNDLHPWNIFPAGGGPARFYDWGDSVVTHPFASMLVTLRMVRYLLGAGDGDRAVLRVRDAYLSVFADLAPHAELVETLEVACRLGMVSRALAWDRVVRSLDSDEAGEFAGAPFDWLMSILDDSYLGDPDS